MHQQCQRSRQGQCPCHGCVSGRPAQERGKRGGKNAVMAARWRERRWRPGRDGLAGRPGDTGVPSFPESVGFKLVSCSKTKSCACCAHLCAHQAWRSSLAAKAAAPKPLSILRTARPGTQEQSMLWRAAMPPPRPRRSPRTWGRPAPGRAPARPARRAGRLPCRPRR